MEHMLLQFYLLPHVSQYYYKVSLHDITSAAQHVAAAPACPREQPSLSNQH